MRRKRDESRARANLPTGAEPAGTTSTNWLAAKSWRVAALQQLLTVRAIHRVLVRGRKHIRRSALGNLREQDVGGREIEHHRGPGMSRFERLADLPECVGQARRSRHDEFLCDRRRGGEDQDDENQAAPFPHGDDVAISGDI